jgi:hypothetical protein
VLLVGGLLIGLVGCGSETGGRQAGSDDARAIVGSPVAVAATPSASPAVAVSVGRAANREVNGPPVAPTPGGAPVPYRSDVVDMGPIVWTTAVDPETSAPLDIVTAFSVDAQAIIATVSVSRWEPATPISAEWSYNGTPLDGFATTVVADDARRDLWLAFHLTKTPEASWPDGIYAIALQVDGRTAQAASVVVAAEGRTG